MAANIFFAVLPLLLPYACAQIDQNAAPCPIAFENTSSIGPDGPWWYIPLQVDFPDQRVKMLPTQSTMSIVINASACSTQGSSCPPPAEDLWMPFSEAWTSSNGPDQVGMEVGGVAWGIVMSTLLGLEGSGQYFTDRMTIWRGGDSSQLNYLDHQAMVVSNNYSVSYPGGASYTLDTGFFSLNGASNHASWTTANGSTATSNHTLPLAYENGFMPSKSYGMHIGSVHPNVTASLYLGGYDASRVLSQPVVANGTVFTLVDVGLNVTSGASAFTNLGSGHVRGLLSSNGSNVASLDVEVGSGVPYMYLPRSTCDAIAEYLPVQYDSDFDLYLWNTDDEAFEHIVTSPHYLKLTFASIDQTLQAINVPFALLNLTLDTPLVSMQTPYFPCRPVDDLGPSAHLGRAFLQAAFLAQNAQTNTMFLAQAPGPEFLEENVKTIDSDATTLAPATNPPSWESTWSATLRGLSSSSSDNSGNGSGSISSQGGSGHKSGGGGLSGGAIAGIVVGAVVALALVALLILWFVRRRKKSWAASQQSEQEEYKNVYAQYGSPGATTAPPQYAPIPGGELATEPVRQIHEADATLSAPAEMDVRQDPTELSAEESHGQAK